jgi:hypothetical protein
MADTLEDFVEQLLEQIQNWYAGQCDGRWEHSFGIKIETLDNPGWTCPASLSS